MNKLDGFVIKDSINLEFLLNYFNNYPTFILKANIKSIYNDLLKDNRAETYNLIRLLLLCLNSEDVKLSYFYQLKELVELPEKPSKIEQHDKKIRKRILY